MIKTQLKLAKKVNEVSWLMKLNRILGISQAPGTSPRNLLEEIPFKVTWMVFFSPLTQLCGTPPEGTAHMIFQGNGPP